MPPRSTKAPKFTTDDTVPRRTSPCLRFSRKLLALLLLRLFEPRRLESTTLLRFLSSSMILASRLRPT